MRSQRCHDACDKCSGNDSCRFSLQPTFCIITAGLHFASIAIAAVRFRRSTARRTACPAEDLPPVSLVRPVCGIDNYAAETLLFDIRAGLSAVAKSCFASLRPTIPSFRSSESLIAAHPSADARLLIGDERVSSNPKLNNVLKGWRAASHDWIIIADSERA